MAALAELGIQDETLLIFTSDNGAAGSMVGHIADRAIPDAKQPPAPADRTPHA